MYICIYSCSGEATKNNKIIIIYKLIIIISFSRYATTTEGRYVMK